MGRKETTGKPQAAERAPWGPSSQPDEKLPQMGLVWSPELGEADKGIRDKFASEYVEDYDPVAAALRCGYSSSFAVHFARVFMGESYTRQKIKELEASLGATSEKEVWRQRITRSLWREATNKGPDGSAGARVSALKEIKNMYGLDAPVETKLEVNSPVQFYIPDNGRDKAKTEPQPDDSAD